MAVAILSTKYVNAMAVEYHSLRPYWLSDNNVKFPMYLLTFFLIIFLGFLKIGIKWKLVCNFVIHSYFCLCKYI